MALESDEKRRQRNIREAKSRAEDTLDYLIPLLSALGIVNVTARYWGAGAETRIFGIRAHPMPKAGLPVGLADSFVGIFRPFVPESWSEPPETNGQMSLHLATQTYVFELVDHYHEEWE